MKTWLISSNPTVFDFRGAMKQGFVDWHKHFNLGDIVYVYETKKGVGGIIFKTIVTDLTSNGSRLSFVSEFDGLAIKNPPRTVRKFSEEEIYEQLY